MKLKQEVWAKAKQITSCFEGWLSGNFDGQYLSFGYLQWNFGQGTLQPLFKRLFAQYPAVAQKVLPGGGQTLKDSLSRGADKAWALGIQKNGVITEPWKTALKNLYSTPEWQSIMDAAAVRYQSNALAMCQQFHLYTDRAFCLMFDIAVQCGGVKKLPAVISLAGIAEAVANQVNPRWQGDVRKRKMAIVHGKDMGRGWPGVVFTDTNAFDISIMVSGRQINPDVAPLMVKDRVLAPVRAIAEALGKSVTWNEATQTVEIK